MAHARGGGGAPGPLRTSELVDRCVVTTLDPHTLAHGQEPLRTLSKHRRWDGNVWFGIRLVPTTTGVLHVGDAVRVSTVPGPATGAVLLGSAVADAAR